MNESRNEFRGPAGRDESRLGGGDDFARNEFRAPVRGGLDVGGGEEVGDDDDAAGTGGEDLGEGLAGDAADAEGGDF